jgi:hypothetical protein
VREAPVYIYFMIEITTLLAGDSIVEYCLYTFELCSHAMLCVASL